MFQHFRTPSRAVSCLLFLVLGLFSLAVIYSIPLNYPPIRGDGIGYYLYLPAAFIFHDLTLQKLAEYFSDPSASLTGINLIEGNAIAPWTGAKLIEGTSTYIIKYPIGEALLLSPFFLLASVVSWLLGVPVNGFSWPFQAMAAVSGLIYGVAGFSILWQVLSKHFQENTIRVCLLSLLFGSNLFHYATYDSLGSHIYSFFLFSLYLWITQALYTEPRRMWWLALGLVSGLIIVTRPTNIIWLVFGLLYGVQNLKGLRHRLWFWARQSQGLLWCFAASCLPIFMQLLYWKVAVGHSVYYSYESEGFNFLQPQILNVLFSVRKGLFFWSPILLAAIPGLLFVRKLAADYWLAALIFMPLNVFIISSWSTWSYGGSFGQRPFLESLPISAVCLSALYESLSQRSRKRLNYVFAVAVAFSSWLMLHYWIQTIPFDGTTIQDLLRTFNL